MFTLCVAFAALLIGFTDAASYNLTLDYFKWDKDTQISMIDDKWVMSDIYIKVGAHKSNGELIEGINFGSVSANTSNRIEIDRSYVFQDSDTDGHIAQFFFTLYGRLADYQGIEYKDAIWGYSNSFEEIEDDICQYPSSDKVDFWTGTWNKMGSLMFGLEAIGGCEHNTTTSTTTMVPWDDDDFTGNITREQCTFMSYSLGSCKPDKHSVSATREYYGYCPDKCGYDWVLRTGTFGARKCGHDGILPDRIEEHSMLVLPCEYGQFRVDDGVAEKSLFMAMLVGIIAFMNI